MTLISLAIAFLCGVLLADGMDLTVPALGLFALGSVLVWTLLVSMGRASLPGLLLFALVLGALRFELATGEQASSLTALHSPRTVQVEGVVTGDPEVTGTAIRVRLSVERVSSGEYSVTTAGDALVNMRATAELVRLRQPPYVRYGDRLLLDGSLRSPPVLEDFDYPGFLAKQGIGTVMSFPKARLLAEGEGAAFYRWLYSVRRAIANSLAELVPEPQASVGQAVLLGMRDNLPPELVDEFRATGTSHLLAISGLHVGVLLGISLAVSTRALGRRRQLYVVPPLVLMWLYALIAGMSPSVARAAVMGSVYMAALALGRPRSVLPALGLAAAVMVALAPRVLWSVSFQLSFAAMAGLALMAEPLGVRLHSLFGRRPEDTAHRTSFLSPIADISAMTIAATFATLPLVAFYFQQVSLVGLPATLLALPVLPLALAAHAGAGILGLIVPALGVPFAWIAWLATAYITSVVGLFARVPGASFQTGHIAPLLVWLYYGAFALWFVVRRLRWSGVRPARLGPAPPSQSPAGHRPFLGGLSFVNRVVPLWLLAPAVALAALVWIAVLYMPDDKLHVTFIDVGEGDSVFIRTPGGRQILVDGGPEPLSATRVLGAELPFWDRTLDVVVLTHPHSDHVAGLTEALRRYKVAHILQRDVAYDTPDYQEWRRAVDNEGAIVTQARAGQGILLDHGVYLQVLGPPETLMRGTASDINNASVVLRLVYGDVSFLLTGDIFVEAEGWLLSVGAPIESDVLEVAHHGSRSSSSKAFLEAVRPRAAVISVGQDNRFGHPNPETVQNLLALVPEDRLFLTAERGSVEFITDGRRLDVRTER